MTSSIKTASLILASVMQSACGWSIIPDEPSDSATSDGDAPENSEDDNNEPTTGKNQDEDLRPFHLLQWKQPPGVPCGPLLLPLDAHLRARLGG
jgi:hypothetical protein